MNWKMLPFATAQYRRPVRIAVGLSALWLLAVSMFAGVNYTYVNHVEAGWEPMGQQWEGYSYGFVHCISTPWNRAMSCSLDIGSVLIVAISPIVVVWSFAGAAVILWKWARA